MSCKDCLHYEACRDFLFPFKFNEEFTCSKFTDKSEWVHLPVKVGDTIYFETYRRGESIGVKPHKVGKVVVIVSTDRKFGCVGADIPDWEFGKTVFLTREEAEKLLEERREK